jgi:hypothetical protein
MNTNEHKAKDFDSIVELLRKDYLSKNAKNLTKRVEEIAQSHISRGLYNSSACISEQLHACYDNINSLVDYIIESLEKDFTHIPLGQCKEKLFEIVDEEYKKLIPFANGFLVNTGLASQSTLRIFEQGINSKKGEVKQAIETKIAIIEKRKSATAKAVRKKPWYK